MAELTNNGQIKEFVEKPPLERPVSIGILVFNGGIQEYMDQLIEKSPEFDLMGDLIPHLIELGKPIYGYVNTKLAQPYESRWTTLLGYNVTWWSDKDIGMEFILQHVVSNY